MNCFKDSRDHLLKRKVFSGPIPKSISWIMRQDKRDQKLKNYHGFRPGEIIEHKMTLMKGQLQKVLPHPTTMNSRRKTDFQAENVFII